MTEYLKLIDGEMHMIRDESLRLRTIYIGGGSPSLLSVRELDFLMQRVRRHFPFSNPEECSIEANPEDLNPDWLRGARHCGVNRISIGVQSLDEAVLRRLGRLHLPETGLRAVSTAAESGFVNLNTDLIIGIPGQTDAGIRAEIRRLGSLPITHLSVYLLEQTPEDTLSREFSGSRNYTAAVAAAEETGFSRYEVSSFSRHGAECRHNLTYWNNEEYLGVGLSAAGYLDGLDFCNTKRMNRYAQGIQAGRRIGRRRRIPAAQRRLATGLRLVTGVPVETAAARMESIQPLLGADIMRIRNGRLSVAPDHMLMLNEILARYVL